MKNLAFHLALRGRGMDVTRLAAEIGAGRCHLVRVLNGYANHGHYTWRKVYAAITHKEANALGRLEAWQTFHGEQSAKRKTGITAVELKLPTGAEPDRDCPKCDGSGRCGECWCACVA